MTSQIASVTLLWGNSDYDISFLPSSNESVYVHILIHFYKCIMKGLKYTSNITVMWRHHYVIYQFIVIWTATKDCHIFIGSITSLNCVFIVIVTSLHLSAIHYNQKIGHAPMINCSEFHQVRIKTKKLWSHPLDWQTSKLLGLDRVKWFTAKSCTAHKNTNNKPKPSAEAF